MSAKLLDNLHAQHAAAQRGDLAQLYAQVNELRNRKLYHQLTERLLVLVVHPYFKTPGNDELITLYNGFLKELESRVKALSMAQILVQVAGQYPNVKEGISFLEQKATEFKKNSTEAYALLLSMSAQMHTIERSFDRARDLLQEVETLVNDSLGIDPLVYSQFYRVLAVFHKSQTRAGEFYRAGLLYLAYTPLESVAIDVLRGLARDLALAGLVADDVYGVGELLSHPLADIAKQDAENGWLWEVLNAYNSGRIETFRQLRSRFSEQMQRQASLVDNMGLIEEKISILALIELLWTRPADGRTVTFADVERATQTNKVEMVIMRALSLGLVKGEIDQVRGVFNVFSVQPRVLSFDQIADLEKKVKDWADAVEKTLGSMEGDSGKLLNN